MICQKRLNTPLVSPPPPNAKCSPDVLALLVPYTLLSILPAYFSLLNLQFPFSKYYQQNILSML